MSELSDRLNNIGEFFKVRGLEISIYTALVGLGAYDTYLLFRHEEKKEVPPPTKFELVQEDLRREISVLDIAAQVAYKTNPEGMKELTNNAELMLTKVSECDEDITNKDLAHIYAWGMRFKDMQCFDCEVDPDNNPYTFDKNNNWFHLELDGDGYVAVSRKSRLQIKPESVEGLFQRLPDKKRDELTSLLGEIQPIANMILSTYDFKDLDRNDNDQMAMHTAEIATRILYVGRQPKTKEFYSKASFFLLEQQATEIAESFRNVASRVKGGIADTASGVAGPVYRFLIGH